MMSDISAPDDLQIISELIEDARDREQHEGHIDPELIQVDVVTDPGLVTDHGHDIDEDQECHSTEDKRYSPDSISFPTEQETYQEKHQCCTQTNIRIEFQSFNYFLYGETIEMFSYVFWQFFTERICSFTKYLHHK